MWICLNQAFLSIVSNPADKATLLVRARRVGDLEHVFGADTVVTTIPGRDYQFRAFLPREQVGRVIAANVEMISYPNFKSSVKDDSLHDAYMAIWHVMADLQPTAPYADAPRKNFRKHPVRTTR
jgi:hypothetical protein